MKVIFTALLLVAGAFGAAVQQNINAEGPACPIADPLDVEGPGPLNVTLHPLACLDEGSERDDIHATGLSTLHYSVDINALLLTATFHVTVDSVDVTTTYRASGYVDARPFRAETVPQGNFTGSGDARITASKLKVDGRATLFINIIGNKVGILILNLQEVSFDSLAIDFSEDFVIGGSPVDWATWSANIKANFDADFKTYHSEIQDKIRLAANNIIGKFTLAELIELIGGGGGGGGGGEEPCETNP